MSFDIVCNYLSLHTCYFFVIIILFYVIVSIELVSVIKIMWFFLRVLFQNLLICQPENNTTGQGICLDQGVRRFNLPPLNAELKMIKQNILIIVQSFVCYKWLQREQFSWKEKFRNFI